MWKLPFSESPCRKDNVYCIARRTVETEELEIVHQEDVDIQLPQYRPLANPLLPLIFRTDFPHC